MFGRKKKKDDKYVGANRNFVQWPEDGTEPLPPPNEDSVVVEIEIDDPLSMTMVSTSTVWPGPNLVFSNTINPSLRREILNQRNGLKVVSAEDYDAFKAWEEAQKEPEKPVAAPKLRLIDLE